MEPLNLNLDGMEPEDLYELAVALRELAFYADHKRHAMDWRKKGEINTALKHEQVCELSYKRLPQWAKW